MRQLILTTMVLMLLSSLGYGADWRYFNRDENGSNCFYDAQNLFREQNTIKVWIKTDLGYRAKSDLIKRFHYMPGIENITYTLDRLEINCLKNNLRFLSTVFYTSEGTGIPLKDFSEKEFSEVVPDSTMDKLVKIICKMSE